jgi:cytoplasmic tRNA 2-thiolation protein 1
MSGLTCEICHQEPPSLRRPKTGEKLCKSCFYYVFETEIHNTIVESKLFHPGETVAIGASGGKDSTVLAYVLKTLNERYNYGVNFVLLSIDEGIHGYRDDSLETVKRNKEQYEMPLEIVSYSYLYGWTMDEIVSQVGKKNNCTYCGVFRRQALDRGAVKLGIKHVVTGHNADDIAETVIMNLLRGDTARLDKCTEVVTDSADSPVKRSKPLKYSYEKEIVLYAHYKKLDYFSTECIYSPEAFRGTARALIKNLEAVRPSSIIDIIRSGETFVLKRRLKNRNERADEVREVDMTSRPASTTNPLSSNLKMATTANSEVIMKTETPISVNPAHTKPTVKPEKRCQRCGYLSSNKLCKACVLLEGLNAGRAKIQIEGGKDTVKGGALLGKQLEQLSF